VLIDHYDYKTDVDDAEDFAGALKLSTTERLNQLLMDQVEDLEARLFDLEETKTNLKRKILTADAEIKDYTELLKQRTTTGEKLAGELEGVTKKLEDVLSKRSEIEAERRKYEQRIAILQTELENNRRTSQRLEKVLTENENLKKQAKDLVTQNGDLQELSDRETAKIAELHKQTQEELLAARLYHNKVVSDIERQIIEERQRGQTLIDDTRKTLKAKIEVMEASIQDFTKSGLDASRDMRKLERNLKTAQRQVEERTANLAIDSRRIESSERKLRARREQVEKQAAKRSELEAQNYALKRDLDSLSAQLEAALYINTKLNAEAPLAARTYVKDPLDIATGGEAPAAGGAGGQPDVSAPKNEKALFDTSVDDITESA